MSYADNLTFAKKSNGINANAVIIANYPTGDNGANSNSSNGSGSTNQNGNNSTDKNNSNGTNSNGGSGTNNQNNNQSSSNSSQQGGSVPLIGNITNFAIKGNGNLSA